MEGRTIEYFDCEQGTKAWERARAGVITASCFGLILDKLKSGPNKGGYKKAAMDYAFRLAIERISGEPLDEGFETWSMRRGKELEPEARALHALHLGRDVIETGFVRTTDGKFGASADGLIGDDEGAEYKCLVDPARLRPIILDDEIDEFMPQIQGCLWLTGRTRWHFALYCPALAAAERELIVHPVERDEDYIAQMESELIAFDRIVEGFRMRILGHERVAIPEPEPSAVGAFGG